MNSIICISHSFTILLVLLQAFESSPIMSSATPSPARSMEQTATWAVAAVCFVMVAISIFLEYILHVIGKWLQKKHKLALYEALEKVKAELMLLGFISLLLTIAKGPISSICVPISVGDTWLPCSNGEKYEKAKKTDGYTDKCLDKPGNRVALMSTYAINQLHYFIFFLAVFHVLYSLLTMTFASAKMRRWKMWEKETRTAEYQYSHDPERFRFARNTTFGRRHLSFWSRSTVLLWIVCFFRQFFRSVLKVDYLTLRHGFIMAHLAPQSASHFDFQKYIKRSFEEDFKVVVGISPVIWLSAILFLLTNTNGWYTSFWLPFIPLVILLLVGTKLQVNITKMGLRIHEKGDVVRGVPMVQPTDEMFWFNRPKFLLFLIHFVLFQNAFQLAFFAWTTYEFGLKSCFHEKVEDVAIRIAMGVVIEFLCSYVTLPLYALVTQMGSTMKPTIFNERVATALKKWHHQARKHTKQSAHGNSASVTPLSSMPTTPTRGMSPVHLLRHHRGELDSANPYHWESEGSPSPSVSPNRRFHYALEDRKREAEEMGLTLPKKEEMGLTEIQISSPPHELLTSRETDVGDDSRGHHQINIELGDSKDDFSFDKRPRV